MFGESGAWIFVHQQYDADPLMKEPLQPPVAALTKKRGQW